MSSGGSSQGSCPEGCVSVCGADVCDCQCPMPTDSYECKADQMADASALGDPERFAEVSGSNGVFLDHCGPDKNLVEYVCETMQICEGEMNPSCFSYQTGLVVPKEVDCVGSCENSVCAARCPDHGDHVTYLAVPDATTAVFVNETDQRRYHCDLVFGASGSCNTEARIGQTHIINGLGLRGGPCTGTDFGNIGFDGCSYRCDILPP